MELEDYSSNNQRSASELIPNAVYWPFNRTCRDRALTHIMMAVPTNQGEASEEPSVLRAVRYVIYARSATFDIDGRSEKVEAQLRLLRAFAEKNSLVVVEEIAEVGSAASPKERPGFETILRGLTQGQWDGVLCAEPDVLSRNPVDSGRLLALVEPGNLRSILTPNRELLERRSN